MTREEQEKREENGRRTEKEQKGEQSEQEEKLASRLEKGKSHFKVKRLVSWHNFLFFQVPFNSRVPGHDDFYHHKRGQ